MSHLRQTAAILVAVAVFTSVAGSPRPEEAKNEIDNTIPKKSQATAQKTIAPSVASSPPPNNVHITRAPPIATSSSFSKFINDVFQIPISVLKAVSNFLSNSFGNGQLRKS